MEQAYALESRVTIAVEDGALELGRQDPTGNPPLVRLYSFAGRNATNAAHAVHAPAVGRAVRRPRGAVKLSFYEAASHQCGNQNFQDRDRLVDGSSVQEDPFGLGTINQTPAFAVLNASLTPLSPSIVRSWTKEACHTTNSPSNKYKSP